MNSINIILCGCVILSIEKSFTSGNDRYKVVFVRDIKEIPKGGEISYLVKYPAADTDKFTEERRLDLCQEGFKQVRMHNLWGLKKKDNFLKESSTEALKMYAVIDSERDVVKIVSAYKCPSDPATYIHVNFNHRDKARPVFQVIYEISRPLPPLELTMYEMQLVEDIVEVTAAEFSGLMQFYDDLPEFDTDEFSEKQRLQFCRKAMLAVSPFEINFLENTEIGSNKYYSVNVKDHSDEGMLKTMIKDAFRCPTEPKMYITVKKGKTKSVIKLLAMIKPNNNYHTTTIVKRLKAVSEQKVAEPLYLQARKMHAHVKEIQMIDPSTQYELCRSIFKDTILQKYVQTRKVDNLGYFDNIKTKSNLSWILSSEMGYEDVDNVCLSDSYQEIKTKNPDLCKRLYESSDPVLPSGQDVIVVGTELIEVFNPEMQEEIEEDTFVCLMRHYSGNMKEYFVSKEYNILRGTTNASDYIASRFVFIPNLNNNNMELVAMAEEYAEAWPIDNIELCYLERRKGHEPAKVDADDPLCRLNSFDRLRLCTIVFDSLIMKENPTPLQNLGCAKNLITFTTEDGVLATDGNLYHEYMIPCYIMYPQSEMYYLSRAYNADSSNDVFSYIRRHSNPSIVLQKLYSDVRFRSLMAEK